ncbi:hypothetical protein DPMN_185741 [Dreissena polymorpha]|uniref:Uncharacterized protein n=1 Tax=Dreissena polymorpha TaxID=45954 RepID=A0A9D4DND3_DREPO|nr:hypothetical protein DPMN_185741 [Dreissena polymorpha]
MLNVTVLPLTFKSRRSRSVHSVLSAPSSRRAYVWHLAPFSPVTITGMIPRQFFTPDPLVDAQWTDVSVTVWLGSR